MNKIIQTPLFILFLFVSATFVAGQQTVVINSPGSDIAQSKLSAADENLIKAEVLPKARKKWIAEDSPCEEAFEAAGVVKGSFSQPGADQTLVFYAFCQTGNGLGNNGLVLIENGKVLRSFVSEGGWPVDLRVLPDINQNGLNEFALYYSGGMHQGQGGTGVDVMEFSAGGLKGIGWFNAETFTETIYFGYKVSVKPGKTPIFYREKYNNRNDKWRKSGKLAAFKLGKAYSNFEVLR
jgi:hypothetical protein